MMSPIRYPFEEVISDKLLLKDAFDKLSPPQQVALKIFYGLPLKGERELSYYNMFLGNVEYDSLGYVKHFKTDLPYTPVEHDDMVDIFGRRSAKTSGIIAFVLTYEAVFGGHTAFASPKQQVASFIVAQKLDVAQAIIRDFIEPLASSSKLIEKEIAGHNAFGLTFKNGHRIVPAPPAIKSFRYFAIPVVAMDEASFWYTDSESANPDFEVARAVSPAQAQFPYRKRVIASTVWTKEGMVWEAKQAGTYGMNLPDDDELKPKYKDVLVLTAPTPAMENPLLQKKWFEKEFRRDPDAYKREILNLPLDSVGGLFSEHLLRVAVENAPGRRDPAPIEKDISYVAAIDPAFRGDDFTFTVGHYDRTLGFVQDLIKRWTPKESALTPAIILDEIAADLKTYRVDTTYSDQYQLESLQQLAQDRGFSIIGMDFTANSKSRIFGSFLQLLRNGRVKLLRNHEQFQQFLFIQKLIGHGGYVRISAPAGKHDDLVTVTVLCAAMAIKLEPPDLPDAEKDKVATPFDLIMASLKAKQGGDDEGYL